MATTPTLSERRARQDGDLTGRVASMTGGTRGIAAAISRRLASQRAKIVAGFSSNRERAEQFVDEVEGAVDTQAFRATWAIPRTVRAW